MKTLITPNDSLKLLNVAELYKYRELIYIFAWRDISVKYKQSILGIGWVLVQPIATMLIFSFFFGKVSKIPSEGIIYPVFVLCGLVLWGLFSSIVGHSSNSMVDNENILKKIYIPKIIIPLSSILVALPDLLINLLLFLVICLLYRVSFSPFTLVYLLSSVILTVFFALGLGLLLSSANVKFRDVRYALPFVLQVLMFTSPIIFPMSILSSNNQILMAFNPLSTAIDLLRRSLTSTMPNLQLLAVSVVSSTLILTLGLYSFQKTEKFFADLV